jgi:hypothetical protein
VEFAEWICVLADVEKFITEIHHVLFLWMKLAQLLSKKVPSLVLNVVFISTRLMDATT